MENFPKITDVKFEEPKQEIPVRYTDLQGNFFTAVATLGGVVAATAGNYGRFFTVPFSCEVIEGWATWGTVGGASALVKVLKLSKNSVSISAGTSVLSANFDITGTAGYPHRIKAQQALSARSINAGDCLALSATGMISAANDINVTVLLRPANTQLSPTDIP